MHLFTHGRKMSRMWKKDMNTVLHRSIVSSSAVFCNCCSITDPAFRAGLNIPERKDEHATHLIVGSEITPIRSDLHVFYIRSLYRGTIESLSFIGAGPDER